MEEESSRGQRRPRKRSRSESSDESTFAERSKAIKKTTTNGFCNSSSKLAEDSGVYGRRIPYFGENSINDILKVVSLQSFSNPRLSLLNEGDRDGQIKVAKGESDCPSDSSEELSQVKERSNSSSEDTIVPSGHSSIFPPGKSRARRGDLKDGDIISDGVGKDQRYWEKRQRNNASAKRSRDARRVRELETQIRAEYLEDENYRLKVENEVLREENARLLKTIERLKNASNKE